MSQYQYINTEFGVLIYKKLPHNLFQYKYANDFFWSIVDEQEFNQLKQEFKINVEVFNKKPKILRGLKPVYEQKGTIKKKKVVYYQLYVNNGEIFIYNKDYNILYHTENISKLKNCDTEYDFILKISDYVREKQNKEEGYLWAFSYQQGFSFYYRNFMNK